ncbi:MAG TPA: glycosyltransferase [Acidimicrobiales bacterium]|nr:glycosyltransferase [Acidimicrobiales bacterium]
MITEPRRMVRRRSRGKVEAAASDGPTSALGANGARQFTDGLAVIVLTYNRASTIDDCLDSLVRQSDPDFDVVVVDDESTDDTLEHVQRYASQLRIKVVANGSHVIARGRNIGLAASPQRIVAFLDSDDMAHPGWVAVIKETFARHPDVSLISGALEPSARTPVAKAIATNDTVARDLFGRGAMQFRAGNCAFNRDLYADVHFNEAFRYAEDLELFYRSQARYKWVLAPSMRIDHTSRETFGAYARQMYRYGKAKAHVSFMSGDFRTVDYVPLLLTISGAALALRRRSWIPALILVPFSLAEAVFVGISQRCAPGEAVLLFPAWLVKNTAWSAGLAQGLASLAISRELRRTLRAGPPRAQIS